MLIFKSLVRSRVSRHRRVFQTLRDIGGLQRANQLVEIAVDHAIKIMERQADAMICHTVLREIVGPNFLFTPARTDLAAALCTVFCLFLAPAFAPTTARARSKALAPCF